MTSILLAASETYMVDEGMQNGGSQSGPEGDRVQWHCVAIYGVVEEVIVLTTMEWK
jgi:hypothetical protein